MGAEPRLLWPAHPCRSRLCLASRRLVALGDECEELWADLEVAMHMFDVHRLTEALRRQRHSVRSVRLAPLMRGRPAVQAAEMEMLVDDFFKALEGGALQQATLVSLVPPGRRPAVRAGRRRVQGPRPAPPAHRGLVLVQPQVRPPDGPDQPGKAARRAQRRMRCIP